MHALLIAALMEVSQSDDGYMRWGVYAAASSRPDDEAVGGFGPSNNHPISLGYVRCHSPLTLV